MTQWHNGQSKPDTMYSINYSTNLMGLKPPKPPVHLLPQTPCSSADLIVVGKMC